MAKSSRASSIKSNNQRLKKNVFGPIETARAERLSAKLLELAAQPKPQRAEADSKMELADDDTTRKQATSNKQDDSMDVDSTSKAPGKKQLGKKKIEKRKVKRSSIVFPKYGERKSLRKRR